jgi:hypothetical protein
VGFVCVGVVESIECLATLGELLFIEVASVETPKLRHAFYDSKDVLPCPTYEFDSLETDRGEGVLVQIKEWCEGVVTRSVKQSEVAKTWPHEELPGD